MKDFNDFWSSLSEDDIVEILHSASQLSSDSIIDQIATADAKSLIICKCLLEKYHNWLMSDV